MSGYIAAWLVELAEVTTKPVDTVSAEKPGGESIPLGERVVPFIPATALEIDGVLRILVCPKESGYLKQHYPGQVAAVWYAWAMSMHNGYGLVNQGSQPIQPLFDGFKKL